ncbi:hypothetical protein [Paucibacter soli]|uniref:hypothetical protein n=1 Tax=Paucibacter soli TaxID=3133433 RepID=UPI0030A4DD47
MIQSQPHSPKGYVAGQAGYLYPALGDAPPPAGAKVLLLNAGCVCITGVWTNDGRFLAWSPLPREEDYHYPSRGAPQPGSGDLLLLTVGGICVFGPWTNDGRYLGWAEKPTRDRAKERALDQVDSLRVMRLAA